MLWIKLLLSLECFEIQFVSNVTMIRFGFSGHLVASSGLVTSVLGSLFIYSMDDTFLSTSVLFARDSATPKLGLLDLISLPLILQLFLYSSFWEVSSTIFATFPV